MKRSIPRATFLAVLVLLTGCEDRKAKEQVEAAKAMTRQATEKLGDLAAKGKDAVVTAARKQAADLGVVAGDLREAAQKLGGEAKVKIDAGIRSLEADRVELNAKVEALAKASGEAWKDAAREIDVIVARMRATMDDVRAKLKGG